MNFQIFKVDLTTTINCRKPVWEALKWFIKFSNNLTWQLCHFVTPLGVQNIFLALISTKLRRLVSRQSRHCGHLCRHHFLLLY